MGRSISPPICSWPVRVPISSDLISAPWAATRWSISVWATKSAKQWSVQLRLDNALDRDYELVSGYNTAGRSVTLAMRFHMR